MIRRNDVLPHDPASLERGLIRHVLSLAESLRKRVEAIEGLMFAELATTGAGEGMIIAGYESEADYQIASGEVASIVGELDRLLTSTPHGHEGTVVLSFGNAPSSA